MMDNIHTWIAGGILFGPLIVTLFFWWLFVGRHPIKPQDKQLPANCSKDKREPYLTHRNHNSLLAG